MRALNKEREEIEVNGIRLRFVDSVKYLGMMISHNLCNKPHIEYRKAQAVKALAKAKSQWIDSPTLPFELKAFIYETYVRPVYTYGMELLDLTKAEMKALDSFDHILLKMVYRLPKRTRSSKFYMALGLDKIEICLSKKRRSLHKGLFEYSLTKRLIDEKTRNNYKKIKGSWSKIILDQAETDLFDWVRISELLHEQEEMYAETIKSFSANDRDVEVIRYCLANRGESNDKLLMSVIGIQTLMNYNRNENVRNR